MAIFAPGAGLEIAELGVRARVSGPLKLVLAYACLLVSPVLASPPPGFEPSTATKSFDYGSYADTNDILMFVTNRGWIGHDPAGLLGRPSGLYFPRGGNKTMIYSAGLWMACKMGKGYRASVAEYGADFSPGRIVNGSPSADNDKSRIYKIAAGDKHESSTDYTEWPFDQGAPALKNSAGIDSLDDLGRRIPLAMGDQTMWSVFNDLNLANHTSDPGSDLPLGAEIQLLVWADEWPGSLGRTVFLNYMIINKGDSLWRDARFGLWADPDLGRSTDDLIGSDSALALGYCYSSGSDLVYGDEAPAVGIVMLSGPQVVAPGDSVWSVARQRWVNNRRALPMNACVAWDAGGDPTGATNVYYALSGQDGTGQPLTDPTNNAPTTWFYSGDPVARTGWIDDLPSDRRLVTGVGPLTIGRGDTIEITIAVVVGQGADALNSVVSVKQAAQTAHALYRGQFRPAISSVVDIVPGACPNIVSFEEPLDLDFDFIRPAAAIPTANVVVALYSTPDFDATAADPREVLLGNVAPSGWTIDDVGRPDLRETPCGCGHSTRDGRVDLLLSYDRDSLAKALEPLVEGAVRTLEIRTVGRDGVRTSGQDCLTFIDLVSGPGEDLPSIMRDDRDAPFALANQPNPFNAATMITYRIATDGPVRLEVFDILGHRMATLVDAWQRVGEYQVMWNGVDAHGAPAGSGMYFYRLQSDDGLLTRKMILLK